MEGGSSDNGSCFIVEHFKIRGCRYDLKIFCKHLHASYLQMLNILRLLINFYALLERVLNEYRKTKTKVIATESVSKIFRRVKENLKSKEANRLKSGKMRATKWRLVIFLPPIG